MRATPASRRAASAVLSAPLLLSLVLVASCQSGSGSFAANPNQLRYSVKRTPGSTPQFVVEASLQMKGTPAEPHILVVHGVKWVTLSVGEAQESARNFEVADEAEDPIPTDVGTFSGTILAVRCRDGKEGRIAVDFWVYRAREGRITDKQRYKSVVLEGTVEELNLPW